MEGRYLSQRIESGSTLKHGWCHIQVSACSHATTRKIMASIWQPLAQEASVAPGDEVEVNVSFEGKHSMESVHRLDPRGAGVEPITNPKKRK